MSTVPKTSKISVIIPTLNEAENLGATLEPLREVHDLEIIVVDGGSRDTTVAIAERFGAKVIATQPGRGRQQNAGAAAADGDLLLFLHGDTRLEPGFVEKIRSCLTTKGVSAGAFSLAINLPGKRIRLVERAANLRSKLLQLPHGDQALFMGRENFEKCGGFPEIAIMEDFALVGRLRKLGRIRTLSAKATTSGRRWQRLGILKNTLINQAIVIGYLLGLSPNSLASWYRISSSSR